MKRKVFTCVTIDRGVAFRLQYGASEHFEGILVRSECNTASERLACVELAASRGVNGHLVVDVFVNTFDDIDLRGSARPQRIKTRVPRRL